MPDTYTNQAFESQLKQRMDNDRRAMKNAYEDLITILGEGEHRGTSAQKEAVHGAIESIFTSLGLKCPNVPMEADGLNEQLEYMMRPSGVMRRRVELKGRWWEDALGPMLASLNDGNVIAVLPSHLRGYEYIDSQTGKRIRVNEQTAKGINVDAFCFYRPLPQKKLSLLDLGLYIFRCITINDIILVLGASLLVSLLGMFTPFINKQIYDNVIPSGTKNDILPIGGLLVGAAIGSALFGVTRSIILTRFRNKINMSVQSAAMMRVFSLPATFFKDYSAGELSSRVMSINQLCTMLSDTLLTSGLSALFSFVYIFQMYNYASDLVAPGLMIVFAMLIFSITMTFLQLSISRKQMKLSAKLSGLIFGLFGGIQKIKLAGAEKRAFAKWAASYKESGRLTYSPPFILRINSALSGALSLGGSLILYYFAAVNKIAISDYIAFNTAYGSVSGAIMSLSGVAMTAANIKPLLEMVKPILEEVPEVDESKKMVTSLSGDIEVSNLTFRYTKEGPTVLNNVSLKIKPGEYVAVVGRTGCGKSTLMRLLLGFEKPESGAVYYDGEDLEGLDVRSVRQCIGVALQNGKLFSGDIYSNIIITAPWKTLNDAWEAARMAGVEEDIKAMPMGMHTMISEGSGGISGGQRQRMLIARAIISKPKILYFDEATSALDNITQKHVADSIANLNCTRLVIAHRLSTIKNCDRIIVLDKGEIVEEGRFEELMEKRGLFFEFASRQIA
ncbi:NHLP bacteriocin export ABC transporter permease/ATPase subunit [Petroclostridium sp. X23]|uniref:NHLP bacteriocin export ABC transporter permease/ATPase subunit n=1 Tax=Petroclostridium sp. X23 TaxID=3045146 RepID=UPI0024AD2998|nr:NHLP bacteriocin export ABC transporter permease/ATPase subunit [Petroclostridium sp. X23]WHH58782.1 NHLP bacteriocin export ABC transporter permease/ATPase subunit [Petroclostridium sp. X23]